MDLPQTKRKPDLVPDSWEDFLSDDEGAVSSSITEEDLKDNLALENDWEKDWVSGLIPHLMDIEEKLKLEKDEVSILVPECGTSHISWHLFDSGYVNILNIDRSARVIDKMQRLTISRYPNCPRDLRWKQLDVRAPGECHVVVDFEGRGFGWSQTEYTDSDIEYFGSVDLKLKSQGCKLLLQIRSPMMLRTLLERYRCGYKAKLELVTTQDYLMLILEKLPLLHQSLMFQIDYLQVVQALPIGAPTLAYHCTLIKKQCDITIPIKLSQP